MMQIVRALKFINTAENQANRPNALPSIIKSRLLMHIQHFDYKTAKTNYKKHMRLLHISVAFSLVWHILAHEGGYPREKNWN